MVHVAFVLIKTCYTRTGYSSSLQQREYKKMCQMNEDARTLTQVLSFCDGCSNRPHCPIRVVFNYEESKESSIRGYDELRRILHELCSNAQDAGATLIEIAIFRSTDDQCVYLQVADNGCGMNNEYCERFEHQGIVLGIDGIQFGFYNIRTLLAHIGGSIHYKGPGIPDSRGNGPGASFLVSVPTVAR